jgi:hypothetical protein
VGSQVERTLRAREPLGLPLHFHLPNQTHSARRLRVSNRRVDLASKMETVANADYGKLHTGVLDEILGIPRLSAPELLSTSVVLKIRTDRR